MRNPSLHYYYFLQLTGDRALLPLSPSLRELRATQGGCEVSNQCRRLVLWEWSGASPRPPSGAPPSPSLHYYNYSGKGLCMIVLVSLIVVLKRFPCFHDFSHGASHP